MSAIPLRDRDRRSDWHAGAGQSAAGRIAAFLVGTLALSCGAVFYRLERSRSLFAPWVPWLATSRLPLVSLVAGQLPSFIHAFAFSCMTGAYSAPTRKGRARACLLWLVIDATIECAQSPAVRRHLPAWTPYGGSLGAGTFDPLDVAAIAIGAVSAFATLTLIDKVRHV